MEKPKIRVGPMKMNTGTRVHGDTKYNRRIMKKKTLKIIEEENGSGLYPLTEFIQNDLGREFQFHEEYGFYLIKPNNLFRICYYDNFTPPQQMNPLISEENPLISEDLVLINDYGKFMDESFSISNSDDSHIFYFTFNAKNFLKTFSDFKVQSNDNFVRKLHKDLEEAVLNFQDEEGMMSFERSLLYFDLEFVNDIFKHVYYKFKGANFSEGHQSV